MQYAVDERIDSRKGGKEQPDLATAAAAGLFHPLFGYDSTDASLEDTVVTHDMFV